MEESITTTELREKLTRHIEEVQGGESVIRVTHYNRPAGVIVPTAMYDQMVAQQGEPGEWRTRSSASIYALTEPGTGEIRYIGKTIQDPAKRLEEHIRSGTPRVSEWIMSLTSHGEQPGIIELESAISLDEVDAVERTYIQQHASPRLLNVTHNPHAVTAGLRPLPAGRSADDPLSSTLASRMFGSVVQQVRSGESVFVSDHGHTVAAVVPIAWYRDAVKAITRMERLGSTLGVPVQPDSKDR